MKGTYFISGIDTNIGKSIATGWLARTLNQEGRTVITQKMVQTGNTGYSEDIDLHRAIMGVTPTKEDQEKITCPEIFSYPASPHLAARIDKRELSLEKITQATEILASRYEVVLLEGAGGLMVLLTPDILTIDYANEHQYPVILVTSGRLGSINHTLLSLEALQHRQMELYAVVYNRYPETDPIIEEDTLNWIENYLKKHFPNCQLLLLPTIQIPPVEQR